MWRTIHKQRLRWLDPSQLPRPIFVETVKVLDIVEAIPRANSAIREQTAMQALYLPMRCNAFAALLENYSTEEVHRFDCPLSAIIYLCMGGMG